MLLLARDGLRQRVGEVFERLVEDDARHEGVRLLPVRARRHQVADGDELALAASHHLTDGHLLGRFAEPLQDLLWSARVGR